MEPQSAQAAARPLSSFMDVLLSDRYTSLRLIKNPFGDEIPPINPLKVQQFFTEGCLSRSCLMGIAGGGLGLLFGGFFFTMRPVDIDTTLPMWQQIKQSYKGFIPEVVQSAKSFAKIGFIFSLVECFIEKGRAAHDINNSVYAGCATGAALAYKSGPGAMLGGCAAFGIGSAVFEHFLGGHEAD
ncbi:unnamed protein product [Vitrella brassicaformis CCMP3155]|uniref:Mitochondrial import inner membrane translocase subunit TIM22 n=2 Tax=Vitrella brassicaformis TaxID=1169539 RepID=A0A0G4GSG5_VITBC|nr:unnamed protein product [Vitrella brassicaformis CCMP3155]|eukprot:CEM33541.1 unnamed protein product [Vitrella brassicaformis CCMP3155]